MKRCFSKLGLIVILVAFLSTIVLALENDTTTTDTGFDEEKSYSWLDNAVQNWNSLDIFSESLAIISLINGNKEVSSGVSDLKAKEDADSCWPAGGCKVTETALATLALYQSGQDVAKEVEWLQDKNGALNPALTAGSWLIQIESEGNGSCTLTYADNKTKVFNINGNKITPTYNNYWIDVERDLQAGLISNKVSEKVDVNCGNLQAGAIVSLLYKIGNNFYILQEYRQSGSFILNNGCYASTKTGSVCDKISTMYASWALKEMNEEIATRAYLESQITVSDILENAIVGRITGKPVYLDFLKSTQETNTGAWSGGNVYITSFAIFSLYTGPYQDQVNSGTEFLKRIVTADGHWGNNIKDTSMALIALHGKDLEKIFVSGIVTPSGNVTITPEICDNVIDDDDDGLNDCNDPDCDGTEACPIIECSGDEECSGGTCTDGKCVYEQACNLDGVCDSGEDCDCDDCKTEAQCEAAPECTSDTDCDSDEICEDGSCVAKEEKKSPLGIIIWIIVIILLLSGLGFFYIKYIKTGKINLSKIFKKKKPMPKQSFEQYTVQRPLPSISKPVARPAQKAGKEEDELEKSLKEAEKLLYGK